MSALPLKGYQERSLEALRDYFRLASARNDADSAFYETTKRILGRGIAYQPVPQLPEPPYVCLRVPTGGGKTLMACHAVGIAASDFLHQEHALVLWLVPTNTIKDQTLAALRDRNHPYRQTLDFAFDGRVSIMDVDEALHIRRAVLDSDTVIIVSTLAAPRIGDTDKRKLYDQNGNLGSPFDGMAREIIDKLEKYEGTDKPIPSLANVICARWPIVIMDEAHNARTELSFETLARFSPSCIIEFTATPATQPPSPSNVLYPVCAAELKAEQMIKLPIRLETCTQWQQTVLSARNKRDELERIAEQERAAGGSYIRPIMLLQAQKKNEEQTVEVVYNCLKNEMGVPESQIAIETGYQSDLNGINLFSPECPVRYIITVDKLREGWDCAFAYVLCSVRDIGSRTAVEQILGRVLRMPEAERREHPDLNMAYAFVTSLQFAETAHTLDVLKQALEGNGFTKFEADRAIQPALPMDPGYGGLFRPELAELSPAERGEPFPVPQLCLWVDGELEPLDDNFFFLQAQWNLAECAPALAETEYSLESAESDTYEVDIDQAGKAQSRAISTMQRQLAMIVPSDITSPEQLALWLDKRISHPDVTQVQSMLFLLHLVEHLTEKRGYSVPDLARDRLRLCQAAEAKINSHRQDVVKSAYQHMLYGVPPVEIEVTADRVFKFDPLAYPANPRYGGSIRYDKHYYPAIGDMNDEEARCAQRIDTLPNVRYWVRNLERRSESSFWLQTPTDKFYPDFVVMLNDGRVLVVEYKGGHLMGDDTREKEALGRLWAERSNGRCVFALLGVDDYAAQLAAIAR
ncbi:MAG: DEAD/DEAH box helicase family protein [Armatimonadetes bacterium]|nr:DEAD/DEAH box helicase family protein [Armatimonadota bacterium]